MNKILCAAWMTGLLSCNNSKTAVDFTVDGTLKNTDAKIVYLQVSPANATPVIVDSSQVDKNGAFRLTANGKEESIYSLRSGESPYPFAVLINDSKKNNGTR